MFTLFSNNEIKLSTSEEKAQTALTFIEVLKPKIFLIIDEIRTNRFSYESFCFSRNSSSGLTRVSGFYLIVNQRTKKVYLGSTSNLAQRKGEHHAALFDPTKRKKLLNTFKFDLDEGQPTDFYFVPLLGISKEFINGFFEPKEFRDYFDRQIEMPLLIEFLNENNPYHTFFYNVKTLGVFDIKNTYGGTPQSGLPSQAIFYENYAWESVTAAAICLNVSGKSIRNKREMGVFKNISQSQFQNFNGHKIKKADAERYFNEKRQEFLTLKQKLGFR